MSSPRFAPAARGAGLGLLLLALAAPAGCSSNARAVVKGKITFGNKPLTMGNIAFVGDSKRVGSGVIKSDGTYVINDAPVGKVKIVVTVPRRPMQMMGRGPNMPKPPKDMHMPGEMAPSQATDLSKDPGMQFPMPDKYGAAETTPLEYTVERGEQTHDITITP